MRWATTVSRLNRAHAGNYLRPDDEGDGAGQYLGTAGRLGDHFEAAGRTCLTILDGATAFAGYWARAQDEGQRRAIADCAAFFLAEAEALNRMREPVRTDVSPL